MSKWQRWKNIMKAVPFEEKRLLKWKPPFIVQPKYDGVRCRAVPLDNGDFLLLSSEENPIFSVPHINQTLKDAKVNFELDGELYCHGMSFEEVFSITSRTVNLHPDHRLIQFHCFDVINSDPQTERLIFINSLQHLRPIIQVSPFWLCGSLDDIMRTYDYIIRKGYEGIIVRHRDAPYERKRSTWIMKFKPKKEDVYEIVGFEEEISVKGRPKGTLGSLWCKSGDGSKFSVGTGFTRDQRYELWRDRDSLIGRYARVKYQHLTSGKKVPRFPVFVEILDKEGEIR